MDFESLNQHLQRYEQTHLLQFWGELSQDERVNLTTQIESIDFDVLKALYEQNHAEEDWAALATRAVSPPSITLKQFSDPTSYDAAVAVGAKAISSII